MEEIIKHYREIEWPRVLNSIKEWKNEIDSEWAFERRKEYLQNEIRFTKFAFFYECKQLAKREDDLTHWSVLKCERLEKKLNKLGMEVKILLGRKEGISPEKIAHARTFPISNFIDSRRGMAKCPFHNEKTPSLDVRKNFYYCYGCGATGDVIDFVMQTRNISFKEAVNYLS